MCAQNSEFLCLAFAINLRKQPTLPSWHFTDVGEIAREIILHPVRSSGLQISRYCGEKCFDMLKLPKEADGGEKKTEEQTEVKAENILHLTYTLFYRWFCDYILSSL